MGKFVMIWAPVIVLAIVGCLTLNERIAVVCCIGQFLVGAVVYGVATGWVKLMGKV